MCLVTFVPGGGRDQEVSGQDAQTHREIRHPAQVSAQQSVTAKNIHVLGGSFLHIPLYWMLRPYFLSREITHHIKIVPVLTKYKQNEELDYSSWNNFLFDETL